MNSASFQLTTSNLNGIRSAANKGWVQWVERLGSDCICVQEVKAQADDVAGRFDEVAGMKGYFQFAQKKGYSGVGVYTRHEPSDVIIGFDGGEFDDEGRYVELRFDRPGQKFSVISAYFPSGSSGEDRQAAKFRFLDVVYPHMMRLKAEREYVLCADVNIAHQNADLKNWKSNQKNSGFLPEERAWMSKLLGSAAGEGEMHDVYRRLHPDTTDECYTWWSNRGAAYEKNVGWRLDYHLATAGVAQHAKRCEIYKAEKFSDHAPLTVVYGADR